MSAHPIRVGPAGWSYTDWEGTVYPKHGSRFDHLAYIASFFDTVEINSPFYRIPPATHARSWVRRVSANPDFRFTTKVFKGFTHEAAAPKKDDLDAFRAYLDPLMEGGRLGCLLLQYPWSFRNTAENRERLERLIDAFAPYPKAVEVRHASFESDEFFAFLDDRGTAFVNVDQPLFHDSVRPSARVTGTAGYVRLHGRNYQKWFAHDEAWERYDYLYSAVELEPWVRRAEEVAASRDTYVITNNHFRGQAVVNAVELRRSLGQDAPMPPQLVEHYPGRGGPIAPGRTDETTR